MARAFFIKRARKPIYQNGKEVKYVSKKGKHAGETLTKIDRTIPQNKEDKKIVDVGQSYYYWNFKNGPTHYSLARPKQSQLTRSGFLSSVYQIEEEMQEANEIDQSMIDEWISNLESLRDECESSLDNMPEGLRESSSSGQLLQERIDNLDSWIQELENIDCDINEDEVRADAQSEWDSMSEEEQQETETNEEDWVQNKFDELLSDKQDEIASEVQSSSPGF